MWGEQYKPQELTWMKGHLPLHVFVYYKFESEEFVFTLRRPEDDVSIELCRRSRTLVKQYEPTRRGAVIDYVARRCLFEKGYTDSVKKKDSLS